MGTCCCRRDIPRYVRGVGVTAFLKNTVRAVIRRRDISSHVCDVGVTGLSGSLLPPDSLMINTFSLVVEPVLITALASPALILACICDDDIRPLP